jgi:plastocyanin
MANKKKRKSNVRRSFVRSKTFALVLAGVIVVLVAAVAYMLMSGDDTSATGRQVRQDPVVTSEMAVTVDVVDRDYDPRDLTLPKGATVTWKFKGDEAHNVVSDEGMFESPTLQKGDEWSLTFDQPDTYTYYCTLHHAMQGKVVVTE